MRNPQGTHSRSEVKNMSVHQIEKVAEVKEGRVRIVKVPHGEHPLFVREAWVDKVLPCYPEFRRYDGEWCVEVPMFEALIILKEPNPQALKYWMKKFSADDIWENNLLFKAYEVCILSNVTYPMVRQWNEMDGGPYR